MKLGQNGFKSVFSGNEKFSNTALVNLVVSESTDDAFNERQLIHGRHTTHNGEGNGAVEPSSFLDSFLADQCNSLDRALMVTNVRILGTKEKLCCNNYIEKMIEKHKSTLFFAPLIT